MNKKHWLIIYIIATLALSLYIHVGAGTIWEFLLVSIITCAFFLGIYFCLIGIRKNSITIKILKIIGVIALLALIWASAAYASIRQFNTATCKDITGENIFTHEKKTYCNFAPWYTKEINVQDKHQFPFVIKVPNSTVRSVATGHTYTISWPFSDLEITSSSKVTIVLTNVSYPHKIQMELFKDIVANRSVQWKVPLDLPSSDRYELQVNSCSYLGAQIPSCTDLGRATLDIFSEGK